MQIENRYTYIEMLKLRHQTLSGNEVYLNTFNQADARIKAASLYLAPTHGSEAGYFAAECGDEIAFCVLKM